MRTIFRGAGFAAPGRTTEAALCCAGPSINEEIGSVMNTCINPQDIVQPFNNAYSHGVVIPPQARVLHTAGQIGVRPDGSLPASIEEQAEQVWLNLRSILRGAGMEVVDIVKVTAFVVGDHNFPAYAAARTRHLGSHRPAATAFCVPQLLKPEWLLEVELIAARA